MEVNEQKVLCITGMHRSGTSLVAMWLECCGIGFATEFLSGPRPFNKKGHFEDERLVALHSSVIEKELSKSKGWIVTKNIDFTFCESDLEKINEILKSYESISDIWAWKDPRTLFFLNSWKKIIPRLKILMIWRPADEVVSSLMRRDKGTKSETAKISLDEAIKTWQVYCEKIIEIKKAFPEDSLVVSIEDIIGQQDKVLTFNGFNVYRFWEHEINNSVKNCINKII